MSIDPDKINYPEKMYYSIGEVAVLLDVNTSLIRFWEKEFTHIKPRKNRRGNRMFTVKDIEDLKRVYNLVKEQGHTLDGARRIIKHNKNGNDKILEIENRLKEIKSFLQEVKSNLPA